MWPWLNANVHSSLDQCSKLTRLTNNLLKFGWQANLIHEFSSIYHWIKLINSSHRVHFWRQYQNDPTNCKLTRKLGHAVHKLNHLIKGLPLEFITAINMATCGNIWFATDIRHEDKSKRSPSWITLTLLIDLKKKWTFPKLIKIRCCVMNDSSSATIAIFPAFAPIRSWWSQVPLAPF